MEPNPSFDRNRSTQIQPAPSKGPQLLSDPASVFYPTPPLTAPSSLSATPTLPYVNTAQGRPDQSGYRSETHHATHHLLTAPPATNTFLQDQLPQAHVNGHNGEEVSVDHAHATGVGYMTDLNHYLSQPSHASSTLSHNPPPRAETLTGTRLSNVTLRQHPNGVAYLQYVPTSSTSTLVDVQAALQAISANTPGPSYDTQISAHGAPNTNTPGSTYGVLSTQSAPMASSASASSSVARTKGEAVRHSPYPQGPSTRHGSVQPQVKGKSAGRHCDTCNVVLARGSWAGHLKTTRHRTNASANALGTSIMPQTIPPPVRHAPAIPQASAAALASSSAPMVASTTSAPVVPAITVQSFATGAPSGSYMASASLNGNDERGPQSMQEPGSAVTAVGSTERGLAPAVRPSKWRSPLTGTPIVSLEENGGDNSTFFALGASHVDDFATIGSQCLDGNSTFFALGASHVDDFAAIGSQCLDGAQPPVECLDSGRPVAPSTSTGIDELTIPAIDSTTVPQDIFEAALSFMDQGLNATEDSLVLEELSQACTWYGHLSELEN